MMPSMIASRIDMMSGWGGANHMGQRARSKLTGRSYIAGLAMERR
jgi:hypothetical protein